VKTLNIVQSSHAKSAILNADLIFAQDRKNLLHRPDPYLSWEVVAAAGKSKAIEIFLNFMVMDMNMNVLLRDPDKADPAQVARMNRFWGDGSWRGAAYEPNPQASFFQENEIIKADDANEKITEAYRDRLLQLAGFAYVPKPLALKNRLGKTIYYLFFASPNKTGQKIVEHIFNTHRE
jgi:three-Cys-motif partner protein